MPDTIRVSWYEHDCDWLTKYCDEHHQRSASVPAEAFMDLVENGDEWAGITVRGLSARSNAVKDGGSDE